MLRLDDLMRLVVMMREWHCNSWWHAYYQEEYAVWFPIDDIDDADDDDDDANDDDDNDDDDNDDDANGDDANDDDDDDDDDNDDDANDWLYDQEEYAGVTPGVGSS